MMVVSPAGFHKATAGPPQNRANQLKFKSLNGGWLGRICQNDAFFMTRVSGLAQRADVATRLTAPLPVNGNGGFKSKNFLYNWKL
jgi:hypothetical protein